MPVLSGERWFKAFDLSRIVQLLKQTHKGLYLLGHNPSVCRVVLPVKLGRLELFERCGIGFIGEDRFLYLLEPRGFESGLDGGVVTGKDDTKLAIELGEPIISDVFLTVGDKLECRFLPGAEPLLELPSAIARSEHHKHADDDGADEQEHEQECPVRHKAGWFLRRRRGDWAS